MKNYLPSFFPSLLVRLMGLLGILLATASSAQAQNINSFSPSMVLISTPTNGTIMGTGLVGITNVEIYNASNILVATVVLPTPSLSSTTVTFAIPTGLALGSYGVRVTTMAAGTTVNASSIFPSAFTVVSVLPVQLVSFAAEPAGNSARLRWNTASEKDNDYFEVEAGADGCTFARVGRVAGHGSTLLPQQYAFTDENMARYAAPLVYYRLRQVDFDGTTSFSQVRTVAVAASKPLLVLYPTVATEGQTTHYTYAGPALAAEATLEVYSLTGQWVFTQPLSEASGTLASPALASGWYWVRLPAAGTAPVRLFRH